jgi:hypothetical protein
MPHMFFFLEISHRKLWEHLLSRTRTNVSTTPSSDSPTIFTSSRCSTVAVCGKPCIAYIVVLTLTAHHQLSIGVTVRLILSKPINEIV